MGRRRTGRLRRRARAPFRYRRDRARIHAARKPHHRAGGRADRQSADGRRRPLPRSGGARALCERANTPRAIPIATCRTCAPSWAACTRGMELLQAAARDHGRRSLSAYMGHVLANAEESVRRLLDRLGDGEFAYPMDNGAVVRWPSDRPRSALGRVRFHRHERPAARQFCAEVDHPGSGALCRAHAGRRCHPDERRVPAPGRPGDPRRIDAQSQAPQWSPAMSRPAKS